MCRNCGTNRQLQAAHVLGRAHDEKAAVIYVDPRDVVPLCGPFANGCHEAYDHHRLDLWEKLTDEERERAASILGAPGARRRISGRQAPHMGG